MKQGTYNMTNNVITENEYKERIEAVFENVSDTLSKTLGPHGSTTILEKGGDVAFTKDGWQVLKKLAFMDEIQNTILTLLTKICARVNVKVGDGTTTSIVASNQLLKELGKVCATSMSRPKDFLDKLEEVADVICNEIQQNATQIDKEGDLEDIYNLALVSTNGEELIARMIQKLYQETKNPAIEYNKSRSSETTYEIVDGYKLKFMTYIDRIFISSDDGTCKLRDVKVLMLDHKLEQEYYEKMIQPAIGASSNAGKVLVVIAPYYDTHLLQKIGRDIKLEYNARKTTSVVYARASLMNNHYADLYNDFAALLGCNILHEQTAYEIVTGALEFDPTEFLGGVGEMTIGEESAYVRDFTHKNEAMLEVLLNDAEAKYNDSFAASVNSALISEDYINSKQRLSKLKCRMGVVNVGGTTELAKTANYDLVEDAVKACESSYLYGIVPGQNISIQTAIEKLLKTETDELTENILTAIKYAFMGVTKTLLENKFVDEDISMDIMEKIVKSSIDTQSVINLNATDIKGEDVQLVLSDDVINSCKTDIEILKGAVSIIGLLLSSNQYITVRF